MWSQENPQRRWRAYTYEELTQRDKCSLDIFWLKDESLEDSENLPDPEVIATEIAEDLRAALEQFAEIQADVARAGRAGANGDGWPDADGAASPDRSQAGRGRAAARRSVRAGADLSLRLEGARRRWGGQRLRRIGGRSGRRPAGA